MAENFADFCRDFAKDCGNHALLLDFDGTLSAITGDHLAARPTRGVDQLLIRLAAKLGLVAIISGRSIQFLSDVLPTLDGIFLFGLYGLEKKSPSGEITFATGSQKWREVISKAAALARRSAPLNVVVEDKGLSLTLHWREHPEVEEWIRDFADQAERTFALIAHDARKSRELRPPISIDKGSVVGTIAQGFSEVVYIGDDLGDLRAFEALLELAKGGVKTHAIAVLDDETPAELLENADLIVKGPGDVVRFLDELAAACEKTLKP